MDFETFLTKETEKDTGVKFKDWALCETPYGIIQHLIRMAEKYANYRFVKDLNQWFNKWNEDNENLKLPSDSDVINAIKEQLNKSEFKI